MPRLNKNNLLNHFNTKLQKLILVLDHEKDHSTLSTGSANASQSEACVGSKPME